MTVYGYGANQRLTRPIRIGIMAGLIASFFVVSPLVILYTSGFRYDWKKGGWQSTGVVSVDVEPAGAEVYINNVRLKQKQPIRLAGLAPGIYHLEIKKTGYRTWQKDVNVLSNQTTYIKDIGLFKEASSRPLNFITETIYDIVTVNDSQSALILTAAGGIWEVKLVNLKTAASELIFSLPAIREQTTNQPSIPAITVSPTRTEAAVIAADRTGSKLLTVINLEKTTLLKTIKYPAGAAFRYQWTTRRSGGLYVSSGRQFYYVAAGALPRALAPLDSEVWFMPGDRDVWLVEGETLRHSEFGRPDLIFAVAPAALQIIDASEKRLIIITGSGAKVFQVDNGRLNEKAALSASEFFYQKNGDEWLTWSPWELSRIYENGDVTLLRRSGEQIAAARPLDNFGAVLLASETALTAFNPGYNVSHELWRGAGIKLLDVDARYRRIYFLEKVNGADRLMSLEY